MIIGMNEIQKQEIQNELNKILERMDIPKGRFNDVGWLSRNIRINNSDHPNILLAEWLIKKMKEGK